MKSVYKSRVVAYARINTCRRGSEGDCQRIGEGKLGRDGALSALQVLGV